MAVLVVASKMSVVLLCILFLSLVAIVFYSMNPLDRGVGHSPVEEGDQNKVSGKRGSYTEANRSGQPYIPGAHESLKPPYSVSSPRRTRREVLEFFKSESPPH